jgi:osmotically inducible protein OsmC
MKITKKAKAHWSGGLKDGKGTISLQSGAFENQPYGFNTRFEDKAGTNPEELIGAAHASCFTMAFSKILGESDFTADDLNTEAIVTLEKINDEFSISKIDLKLNAKIGKIDETKFIELANKAKENCPISKLFKTEISLSANLLK